MSENNQNLEEDLKDEFSFLSAYNSDGACDVMIANQDGKYLRITGNCDKLFFSSSNSPYDSEDDSFPFVLRVCDYDIEMARKESNDEDATLDDIIKDLLYIGIERDIPDCLNVDEAKKLLDSQETLMAIAGKFVKIDPNLDCGLTNLTFSLDLSAPMAMEEEINKGVISNNN